MKKLLLTGILMMLCSQAFTQEISCLDKLLPYSRHSGLHQMSKEEWNDGKVTFSAESASSALSTLIRIKLMCRPEEVVIKIQPSCQTMHPDLPQSNVCYAFTNLGYFFISKDKGRTTNFIFSKDPQFRE